MLMCPNASSTPSLASMRFTITSSFKARSDSLWLLIGSLLDSIGSAPSLRLDSRFLDRPGEPIEIAADDRGELGRCPAGRRIELLREQLAHIGTSKHPVDFGVQFHETSNSAHTPLGSRPN